MFRSLRCPALSCLALAACSAAALADTYSSSPVYGGREFASTGRIGCRIFNSGDTRLNITQRRIFSSGDTAMTLDIDNCLEPLGVNKYCVFPAPSNGNNAYSCKLVTSQSNTKLRGVAEFMSSTFEVTNALPMEK